MNQRLRRTIISLGMELLTEAIPLVILLLVAYLHQRPFPFAETVGSSMVTLVAFGFLLLTFADFWIERRAWDLTTVLGVVFALIVFGQMAVGFHVHFLAIALPDLQTYFLIQLLTALIALIYSAAARASGRE